MFEIFLYVGLPYAAILTCIVGTLARFRSKKFGVSSLSSQFLESKKLLWGSVPWHLGILFLFIAHLLALGFPGVWQIIVSSQTILMVLEAFGIAAAVLCTIGIIILAYRRITTARLQPVTSTMDIMMSLLLLTQILLGLFTAINHRWGAAWSTGTLAPYLWSILKLQPDSSFVMGMPFLVKAHIVGAWLILLMIPFTRLAHMFSFPYEYLYRPFQKVVWFRQPSADGIAEAYSYSEARRHFLKGTGAIAVGGILLSLGVMDKLASFFQKPDITPEEEATLLETRLRRLQLTAEERELELERQRNAYIMVARLNELNATKGKYFIDYEMRPALAFLTKEGVPLLISAKCTHLGCTVGGDVNESGQILCPCHISYFNIETGQPNIGAPAKKALDHIGWVIMDNSNNIVASKIPGKTMEGIIDITKPENYSIYIAKNQAEIA